MWEFFAFNLIIAVMYMLGLVSAHDTVIAFIVSNSLGIFLTIVYKIEVKMLENKWSVEGEEF